jgi:hypothetical protein
MAAPLYLEELGYLAPRGTTLLIQDLDRVLEICQI